MEPWLTQSELSKLSEVSSSGWIGSQGPAVMEFEEALTSFLNQPTLSVANGSVALVLALTALDVSSGDEVIVPDFTYAAVASSVIHVGAVPVFADVKSRTWQIELDSMRPLFTSKTKAVIIPHSYGTAVNIQEIVDFCHGSGISVIEDSSEAFTGSIEGKKLGTFGDVGTFSFFPNKIITTGEGGAVTTNKPEIFKRMQLLRGQGMDPAHRYWFLEPGFNFRLSSLHASIGTVQLARIGEICAKRMDVEKNYLEHLGSWIDLPMSDVDSVRAPWIFSATIKNPKKDDVWRIASELAKIGIESRPLFYQLSSMPAFSRFRVAENPVSREISAKGISLPSSHRITTENILDVREVFSKVLT
jgi:perosamine synthetase